MPFKFELRPVDVTNVVFYPDPAHVVIGGRACERVSKPSYGPLMIEHVGVRMGRPTSVFDVIYTLHEQQSLYEECRCVPCNHAYEATLTAYIESNGLYNAGKFEVVQASQLHRDLILMTRMKGRPTAFLEFNYEQLRQWRSEVYEGKLTIRDLARLAGVSEPAAARFARGELLWYV